MISCLKLLIPMLQRYIFYPKSIIEISSFSLFLKKIPKIFGSFKNTPYLCTRKSARELNKALKMMHP